MTKPRATVERALELIALGDNDSQISRALSVSRAAVRDWRRNPEDALLRSRASHAAHDDGDDSCEYVESAVTPEYSYLLGQYLGDGCISAMGPRGVFRLRIATCDDYPLIRARTADAIAAVMPDRKIGYQPSIGCTEVYCHSKHWPCLFPQHGPGRKHERSIQMTDWQVEILNKFPREFVAGLIHSDGCRCINNVVTRGKAYAYPRYFFTNTSADILDLCGVAFDVLGIQWRKNRWNSLSVAQRASVAYLDTFIGPKA
jgi:hypothetical protein